MKITLAGKAFDLNGLANAPGSLVFLVLDDKDQGIPDAKVQLFTEHGEHPAVSKKTNDQGLATFSHVPTDVTRAAFERFAVRMMKPSEGDTDSAEVLELVDPRSVTRASLKLQGKVGFAVVHYESCRLNDVLKVLDQGRIALGKTVGDGNGGLVKDVADLHQTVGDSTGGLVKDVTDLDTVVGDSSSGLVKDVTDLDKVVGDSTSGLVKDVADLKATAGTTPGSSPAPGAGPSPTAKELQDAILQDKTQLDGFRSRLERFVRLGTNEDAIKQAKSHLRTLAEESAELNRVAGLNLDALKPEELKALKDAIDKRHQDNVIQFTAFLGS